MKVYRWENAKGYGPYIDNNISLGDTLRRRHHDTKYHPGPCQDGGLEHIYPTEVCGFRSLRQMHKWFSPDDIKLMMRYRYKLVVYDIDEEDIRFGRKQVVFKKKEAKPVREVKLRKVKPKEKKCSNQEKKS